MARPGLFDRSLVKHGIFDETLLGEGWVHRDFLLGFVLEFKAASDAGAGADALAALAAILASSESGIGAEVVLIALTAPDVGSGADTIDLSAILLAFDVFSAFEQEFLMRAINAGRLGRRVRTKRYNITRVIEESSQKPGQGGGRVRVGVNIGIRMNR